MDLLEMGLSALITGLTVFISGYVMFHIGKNNVKDEIYDFLESEEGQKLIFGVGALIGNGAKAGLGLAKTGGKFGIKELVMGIAGKWLERSGILNQEEQPQQQKPEIEWKSPLDRKS